ncbi:MAG: hypothetical protein HQM10_13350 [Candidatus Riflebacteria bacterium]|nr:hypothetical protein [Candidatus Riflebacteria bacterium]
MNWLDKLERKVPGLAIPGLMRMISMLMFLTFALDQMQIVPLHKWFLSGELVMAGEVWRLLSFIFIPPASNMIFLVFALMIIVMTGDGLELEWGSFRLTVYYLFGLLANIAIAFIFPDIFISNSFLNLSLFLAFATVYPDYEILLFFILPVKIKYLALISAVSIVYGILFGPMAMKAVAILSIANYLLFFGPLTITSIFRGAGNYQRRKKFEESFKSSSEARHICTSCGRSEKSDPELVFRYCVCKSCQPDGKAFCTEHLQDHLKAAQ